MATKKNKLNYKYLEFDYSLLDGGGIFGDLQCDIEEALSDKGYTYLSLEIGNDRGNIREYRKYATN